MQRLLIRLFKVINFLYVRISCFFFNRFCSILFYLKGVKVDSFNSRGFPYIHKSLTASILIGNNFVMNNGARYSDSGTNGKCRIEVRDFALLNLGNNVGMSDVTITCHNNINIGNNVLLGVGVQIRDTDNHSLNPSDRLNGLDWKNKRTLPISISDNVFIGANSFILKGVSIGKNSVVGASSVVTKNIPDNEIWAGNPARFIKRNKL